MNIAKVKTLLKELEEKWKLSKTLTKRFPEFNDYVTSRKEKDTKAQSIERSKIKLCDLR